MTYIHQNRENDKDHFYGRVNLDVDQTNNKRANLDFDQTNNKKRFEQTLKHLLFTFYFYLLSFPIREIQYRNSPFPHLRD